MSRGPSGGDFLVAFAAFASAVGVFVLVTLIVGFFQTGILSVELHMHHMPRLSITAVFAVIAAVLLSSQALLARTDGHPTAIVAVATIGWFPVLAAIGDYELGEVLVRSHENFERGVDPNDSTSFLSLAPRVAVLIVPLVTTVLAPLVARRLRGAFAVAVATWVLGAVLVIAGLARASRRPDPDTYFDRLPRAGTIALDGEARIGETDVHYAKDSIGKDYNSCYLERAGTPSRIAWEMPCRKLVTIARDDEHHLWILGAPDEDYDPVVAALRMDPLEQVAVHVRTIPKSLAPPIGWLLGALAGVLLALIPLATAFVLRRRAQLESGVIGASASSVAIVTVTCATLFACAAHGILFF